MNAPSSTGTANSGRAIHAKPPPSGPAPPAPAVAPPAPPVGNANSNATAHTPAVNGTHAPAKPKKKEPSPVDPAQMYESLKNRIAVLEEDAVQGVEEEKRYAEEAQKSVKGLEDNAVHAKYIELFSELKRVERDHAKEKQKLTKDKDAAKVQLTKANQTKTKMENIARELQKENKRLREDSKRLAQRVEDAQDEISQLKTDVAKRVEKAKIQDVKYREQPDIVVKVVCRYRAELFFKISRKTKLTRLFTAWTDRMEAIGGPSSKRTSTVPIGGANAAMANGTAKPDTASVQSGNSSAASSLMQFVFTHNGKTLDADLTPEEAGVEDADEILAVELMDLTEGPDAEDEADPTYPQRQKLKKNWTDNPGEAQRSLEDMFDGVVRERLKDILRQYELRERHFECVIRSKELEVLLSRARAAEQKQLAEGEQARANKAEDENLQLRKELEDVSVGQNMLIEKIMDCCKEPNADRMQRLFTTLSEELAKRPKPSEASVG